MDVTVYEVIAEPPFEAGAVKATLTCPLPAVAVPTVGAPGTVTGVAEFEADEAELVPVPLVAVTLKVYAVPLVRPVIVIGDDVPVAIILPGLDVTLYPVIAEPPFETGAVKVRVT